ncbi:MAG: carbohydrate ABC transporter permease [Treponema sp.]|nr:carbohydrate ABC transporter permease [Treponema sp.]
MRKTNISYLFIYLILIVIGFLSFFPFYYILSSATNKSLDIIRGRLFFGVNLIKNLENLLTAIPFLMGFWNSMRNALVQTVGCLFICSLAGYGFQIYRSKAKDRLMTILLLSMMIPFATMLIPLFRITSSLKLLNTTAGIVLPYLSTVFVIFFFRQSTQSFPIELVQAARVDGVGEIGIFFRIFMPVMAPTYAAAAIVVFLSGWNNYLWPLVVLQRESTRTLPVLIAQLGAGYVTDYGVQLLAITISIIPTLILFFSMQRQFVEGILGSVK